MAFVPQYMTGFEIGTVEIVTSAQRSAVGTIESVESPVHTGNRAFKLNSLGYIYFNVDGSPSELYAATWVYFLNNAVTDIKIACYNGNYVKISLVSTRLDAYVGAATVKQGTISLEFDKWYRISVYVLFDPINGVIEWKVDDVLDNRFEGSTVHSPGLGSTSIEFFQLINGFSSYAVFDDLMFGSGGYPPDLRADVLVPDADTATEEWDLSAGSDTYALINEVPPSDTDYIYTSVNGEKSIVTLSDWDSTNKVPRYVTAWVRAKKDESDVHQIKVSAKVSADVEESSAIDIFTDYRYFDHIFDTAPDLGVWTAADVDDLEFGIESIIV